MRGGKADGGGPAEDTEALSLGGALAGSLRQAARAALLAACCVLVIMQLSKCWGKLRQPPVSTHTSLKLNASVEYPAITVCRTPAYRGHVLQKYNLSDISMTSQWRYFPYEDVTLEEFWEEATYSRTENLRLYALHKYRDNVLVEDRTFLLEGRCFTLRPAPAAASPLPKDEVGYSLMLGNRSADAGDDPPEGWTLYVHESGDPYLEESGQAAGRQERVDVDVGEELRVSLGVHEFRRLDRPQARCNASAAYSFVQCLSECLGAGLAREAGCSAPWLPGSRRLPPCRSAEQHHRLLVSYTSSERPAEAAAAGCGCAPACSADRYSAAVVKRGRLDSTVQHAQLSQLYLSFASKQLTRVEERPGYDWSAFVADTGGSVGFLLGLSVLGVLDLFEHAARFAFPRCRRLAAGLRRPRPAPAPDPDPESEPQPRQSRLGTEPGPTGPAHTECIPDSGVVRKFL